MFSAQNCSHGVPKIVLAFKQEDNTTKFRIFYWYSTNTNYYKFIKNNPVSIIDRKILLDARTDTTKLFNSQKSSLEPA